MNRSQFRSSRAGLRAPDKPSRSRHLLRCVAEALEWRRLLTAYQVTSLADVASTASNYDETLRWAVQQANDNTTSPNTITFASGLSGQITLTQNSYVLTGGNTSIEGPGQSSLTINGSGQYTIFVVDTGVTAAISGMTLSYGVNSAIQEYGANLSLSAVTITQSVGGNGGALANNGTANVSNCTFSDDLALSTGNNADGGAIYSTGTLYVSQSAFSDDAVLDAGITNNGGAIFSSGTLYVTESTISRCSTGANGQGGGIYNTGTLDVTESTISGDSAAQQGGGIFSEGPLTVVNSTVSGDYGASYGGGIYGGDVATITNCTISSDSVGLRGGGIFILGQCNVSECTLTGDTTGVDGYGGGGIFGEGTLYITQSIISDSSASTNNNEFGGGIEEDGGTLTITNSTLSGDTASRSGGAISGGKITVTNCIFSGDSAAVDGGGIYGASSVSNSNFSNDSAASGGGIANLGGPITITNSTFSGDSASTGGGIYNGNVYQNPTTEYVGTVTITNCTLSGNTAAHGGGIFNYGTLNVVDSTISGDSAGRGGGIYNENFHAGAQGPQLAVATITNSTISGDMVKGTLSGDTITLGFGGGVDNTGYLTIDDSTLSNNGASPYAEGGGMYIGGTTSQTAVENTIVAGNAPSDIQGALTSGSYNLIGNGTDMTGLTNGTDGNQVGTAVKPINPLLGNLTSNGGPTQTMEPALNSPEMNAGIGFSSVSTDQRGEPRPTSGAVDIGAVQRQASAISISGTAIYLQLASDGETLDVYYNNTGAGTPVATYFLPDLVSLTATGTSGNDQLTIDYSDGIPIPPGTGFTYDGLGGTNTLKVIGTEGNDTIDFNPTTVTLGGSTASYADAENLIVDPLAGDDSLTIASGLTVSFPVAPAGGGILTRDLSSLTLGANAVLVVPTAVTYSTDRTLLVVQSASIGSGAAVNLGGNDADFTSTPLSTVNSWVQTGYNGGNWNGSGIASSFAAADTLHLGALGVIQNNQSGTALFTSTNPFDGTVPGASDILVKYTYYGDANLDGKVDATDYSLIDNGYLNHLTGWFNGDFNYDGLVNGSDYTLIDNAFNKQGAALAGQISLPIDSVGMSPQTRKGRTETHAAKIMSQPSSGQMLGAANVFSTGAPIATSLLSESSIEDLLGKRDVLDGLQLGL